MAFRASAFWPHTSPAKGSQRGGILVRGDRPPCVQSPHTRQSRGNTVGFLFLFPTVLQHFLSLLIKWVRASARKSCRLPLAASQALCLPHLRVGKNLLFHLGFTYRSPFCALVFSSFPWYTEFTMEVYLCTLHIMYLTSPAARKSQQKSFRPPSLTFASPCRIVGRPVGCPSIFRSHFSRNTH